mmetsp:Transcript_19247/g.33803  ORF Transcript_19247/g.33803 Transcript_19247/m.33803 type:complete len:112 (-) Transcript_19247:550-885(-)
MTRVVQENGITIFRLRNHRLVGIDDVLIIGLDVLSVIHENHDVFFFESMHIHDVVLHVEDIIPASLLKYIPKEKMDEIILSELVDDGTTRMEIGKRMYGLHLVPRGYRQHS